MTSVIQLSIPTPAAAQASTPLDQLRFGGDSDDESVVSSAPVALDFEAWIRTGEPVLAVHSPTHSITLAERCRSTLAAAAVSGNSVLDADECHNHTVHVKLQGLCTPVAAGGATSIELNIHVGRRAVCCAWIETLPTPSFPSSLPPGPADELTPGTACSSTQTEGKSPPPPSSDPSGSALMVTIVPSIDNVDLAGEIICLCDCSLPLEVCLRPDEG